MPRFKNISQDVTIKCYEHTLVSLEKKKEERNPKSKTLKGILGQVGEI